MEFKIDGYDYKFRVREMNAIEALALQTQVDFKSYDKSLTLFCSILECLEVKCDKEWLPVKTKGVNVFYPAGVENDVNLIKRLVETFMRDYFKPLFQKSDASK